MTSKERLEKIISHLTAGGRVMTCSYTRPIVYDNTTGMRKHRTGMTLMMFP